MSLDISHENIQLVDNGGDELFVFPTDISEKIIKIRDAEMIGAEETLSFRILIPTAKHFLQCRCHGNWLKQHKTCRESKFWTVEPIPNLRHKYHNVKKIKEPSKPEGCIKWQ